MPSRPRESSGPGGELPFVRLRQKSGTRAHPWVYRRMIKTASPGLRSGDEVVVLAAGGEPLGRGLHEGHSTIAVRLLSSDPERTLDAAFFRDRLARAAALRRDALRLDRITDAYRVVHSEGDGLSGLLVDRYADLLVAEFRSEALWTRRQLLLGVLGELFPGSRLVARAPARDRRHRSREDDASPADDSGSSRGGEESDREAWGEGVGGSLLETVEIRERKMRFRVDPRGHKTGFFLDQRDNRGAFADLVRGREVLDAFSYTGGFAIAARTLGRARRVTAVDLDEWAVEEGKRNARLNRAEIEWRHEDVFHFLRRQVHSVRRFGAVSLDPPKWAARREDLEEAERRYLDLNAQALPLIEPGGILLTCSCSGLLSERRFLGILDGAAARAGRRVQIFRVSGAAPDHPFDSSCPESRYLTAAFARIW